MNRLAIASFALFLTGLAAPAAGQAVSRTITVNGQAEIRVAPDEVLLSVGVETDHMDIARARADNDTRIKAIVDAAAREGVRAEHVKTEFLDIQPRYRDEHDRRTFLGYFARRSLSITLRDVARFETLLSAITRTDIHRRHGQTFTGGTGRRSQEARGHGGHGGGHMAAGWRTPCPPCPRASV